MPELLLEILSEEIPARMQARAADDLKRLVTFVFDDLGIEYDTAESFFTPRRLALVVTGLPAKQPDTSEEKRGPNVNAPEQAINGFKGSLPEGAVIEERETPKGTFYFATVERKGHEASRFCSFAVGHAVSELNWSKSMRWGSGRVRWVRPLHSIIGIVDGEPIPYSIELYDDEPVGRGIVAGNTTVGHRFLAPDAITVTDFTDYKARLLAAKVMLDPAERQAKIEADAKALCEAEGLSLKDDPGLLDEVTGLVEWPVVLMGTIDDAFMELPDEVLSTSMRSHQKYFSTLGTDGKLANKFIVVANTETKDDGQQVVAGNERVLRARLSDAKFFWDQDRATKLESRVDALAERVFHAKLGNLLEKVGRVEELAVDLVGYITEEQEFNLRQAAKLAKADLSTGMVGEFPELQGIMGRYYAQNDGKDAEICDAIAEHYSPLGPSDICPTQFASIWVALADKIDTLVGFFAIDERPTGSKDPYALRRAALGVIRLILENGLRLSLKEAFAKSFLLQPESVKHAYKNMMEEAYRALAASGEEIDLSEKGPDQDISYQVLAFFADRLKVHLREQGVRHDLIDAVFALGGEDDLVRLINRVEALQGFLKTEDGENLLTAYRRAANILRAEEKKDGISYNDAPDPGLLTDDAEKALADALDHAKPAIENALAAEDFVAAMQALAGLRKPVDTFFDDVTVNADDAALRANRLKLLNGIRASLDGVADFSKIEGR
ncbi:MAG: glycine--tRNA ligase subunit beta [Rhodospirillales bacterium]